MPYLEVPGANLFYETAGAGPVLLCITGANGSLEFFQPLAEELRSRFTVVMYDRRGFSRSHLIGAQDYDDRIETDADDVAALLKHNSPGNAATVLGNSSGALVALMTLVRHSDLLRTVIPHEPPAHKLLPDWEQLNQGAQQLYRIYRKQGVAPALEFFAGWVKLDEHETAGLLASMDPRSGPYTFANSLYWFEREGTYGATAFDIDALGKVKEKLVLANGEDTDKEAGHYRPNVLLAEKLGLELKVLPGAHLGAVSHAKAFAEKLVAILDAR